MTSRLPFTTRLRNAEVVLVREIGPADRPLMRDGFAGLSEQSRFFRFLGAHGPLSEAELDRFTETNTDSHFAIGAAAIGVDADLPLATARFVRADPQATTAEIALTIIDSHQRIGLGSLLLCTLAAEAHMRGITTLQALLHRDNTGMAALLEKFEGVRQGVATEVNWLLPLPLAAPMSHIVIPRVV